MSGGRITCSRCGANNFDTVTVCWKCNTPLSGAVAAAPMPAPAAPAAYSAPAYSPSQPVAAASFVERAAYQPAIAVASAAGNPSAANRAAFWLGLLMPYFGLPIGLAFMMCDDRRRQEVGRICIFWSLVSGVIHLLFMIVAALGMRQYFGFALNTLRSQMQQQPGMGGGAGGDLGL
jgi:hypothetical protein